MIIMARWFKSTSLKENTSRASAYRYGRRAELLLLGNRTLLRNAIIVIFLVLSACWTGFKRIRSFQRRQQPTNNCKIEILYKDIEELEGRSYRFPSIDERIAVYMSNWYRIPCAQRQSHSSTFSNFRRPLDTKKRFASSTGNGYSVVYQIREHEIMESEQEPRFFQLDGKITPARMFYVDLASIQQCAADTTSQNRMRNYCKDVNETILQLISTGTLSILSSRAPVLLQFGDASESLAPDPSGKFLLSQPRIPHMKKFRLSLNRTELDRITHERQWTVEDRDQSCKLQVPTTVKGVSRLQPIIWKLNTRRHFGNLYQVPCQDKPWNEKKNKAIFRGKLTGSLGNSAPAGAKERCIFLPRCRLILEHQNSPLVDARLTSTTGKVPDIIDGFNVTAPVLPMKDMLSYKGIIVIEGNDVSSGLKWALLSSSVVLMPEPMYTSWAMEELLEPWIHYIPIARDFSDINDKVSWMIRHESEARRISYRASLWIKDLVFHPRAAEDEDEIFREILDRYARQFDVSATD